jgi:F-type H+-transporting ATPase subunit b
MPQLDPSSYFSQLFWLAVTFTLLYLVLAKATLPQISKVLQNRRARITSDLDRAESLRREAEKVATEYEAALAENRAKAAALIQAAKHKAEEEADFKREELDRVMQKKLSDAERRMTETRKKVMADLKPAAAELAALVVKEVTGRGIKNSEAEEAMSTVIKEIVNGD